MLPNVARSEMARKPRTNLGNLFQRKAALLSSCRLRAAGETFAYPLDGVGEDDEADEGVTAGFGEDGVLACGVGVERAGGGGFGGVVDGEASPDAIGVIAHVEGVADEREGEERERAECEDGGDGGGGVFFVGVDRALCGDDGGDSADAGADGEERGELRAEVEGAA